MDRFSGGRLAHLKFQDNFTGYDMLKDIEFRWPIARMVLNHVYKWSSDLTAQFIKLRYYLADYSILESLSEVLCSYSYLYS